MCDSGLETGIPVWGRSGSRSGCGSFPKFYTCWKIRFLTTFICIKASLHCFIYLLVKGVLLFNILDSILNLSVKRNNELFTLVEMDSGHGSGSAGRGCRFGSAKMMLVRPDPDSHYWSQYSRANPTIIPILPAFPCELIQLISQKWASPT